MTTETKKIHGMAVHVTDSQRAKIGQAIDTILEKGWLMWGDWQDELSAKMAALTGKKNVVTFNSATSALEILFTWLERNGKHRVGIQANSFPSVAFAARRAQFDVVFVDIDIATMSPTVEQLEGLRLDTFVLQHNGGFITKEIRQLMQYCDEMEIFMVEDASHAAGSEWTSNRAGHFGHAAVSSLAATKPLQTGQGGLLYTNDDDLAQFGFQMKNYGRTEMFQKGVYVEEGWNAHMTEMQAAIGVILLADMDAAIEFRYVLADIMLDGIRGLVPLGTAAALRAGTKPNLYKLPFLAESLIQREALEEHLLHDNIEPGSAIYRFVTPQLRLFGSEFAGPWPNTVKFSLEHFCLPLHNAMSIEDAERVNQSLRGFFG